VSWGFCEGQCERHLIREDVEAAVKMAAREALKGDCDINYRYRQRMPRLR
jgi:hypothetical protein